MHTFGFDAQTATMVSFLSGQNHDDDIEDFVQASMVLDQEGLRQKKQTAQILVVEEGHSRPSPNARRRLADSVKLLQVKKPLFALITKSALVRGVITAVRWINPQQVHDGDTFATFEEGVRWLEQKRGESLPIFFTLLTEARGKASLK